MPSDVPEVISTRSGCTGTPRAREVRGHGFARFDDARRRRVAVVAVAHRALDGFDQMRRRDEAELVRDRRCSDSARACRSASTFLRLGDDVADGVGEAIDAAGGADAKRWRRTSRSMLTRSGIAHVATSGQAAAMRMTQHRQTLPRLPTAAPSTLTANSRKNYTICRELPAGTDIGINAKWQ